MAKISRCAGLHEQFQDLLKIYTYRYRKSDFVCAEILGKYCIFYTYRYRKRELLQRETLKKICTKPD